MKNKRYLMLQWIKEHSLILKLIFFGSVLVFVANQVANIANGMDGTTKPHDDPAHDSGWTAGCHSDVVV